MADIIQAFIDGTGNDSAWDDFVCGAQIADPTLEAIRSRCALLPDEFPPTQQGHFCGEGGAGVMRAYVNELRT